VIISAYYCFVSINTTVNSLKTQKSTYFASSVLEKRKIRNEYKTKKTVFYAAIAMFSKTRSS
jgi:hypothetical protein